MNNNNLISCQDLADIRYFLSKLASEHCTDIEHIDNLICKLTSLQVNLQYNHPLLIKDNSILIDSYIAASILFLFPFKFETT